MADRGLFIVLEGGEGAGKTTQVALLSGWMREAGVDHVAAREPGGTPVGEAIREVVLARADLDVPVETELLLILAARAAFVRDVVRPALEEGKVVLADRFALSTLAYQGYGRGLDLATVRSGIDFATGGLRPDLYIVLDLPVPDGTARQRRAGGDPDRIERAGDGFLERVRQGYLELAGVERDVATVAASGTAEEVHRRLRGLLHERFPETFRAPQV
ncbi:MAG: dTMP kinase [Gemmatimonadota bacterium]|nr:dTMP kinase [Gemmatimonadota bacterium]